jgi:hypothetical protein
VVDFTLPPSLTSLVTAVNVLLSSIGESPVGSVDVTEAVDVAKAVASISEISNAVQSEGWHWNREYSMALSPDTDGIIALPAGCLSIMVAYYTPSGAAQYKVTERARKLYDPVAHTYVFTAPVTVDMIVLLEWEEMPEYARRFITIRAAQLFQGRVQVDRVVASVQQPELDLARSILEQREDDAQPANQVNGNVQVTTRLHGRGLRRRGN